MMFAFAASTAGVNRTNLLHHGCELLVHGSGGLHGCVCRRSRSGEEKGGDKATQRVKVLGSLKEKEFPSQVVVARERRGKPTNTGKIQQSASKPPALHVGGVFAFGKRRIQAMCCPRDDFVRKTR